MKQIFFIAAFILSLSVASSAQVKDLKSVLGNLSDTVSNTATKTLTSGEISGYYKVATIVFSYANISGTDGGTATLYGSIDKGVTWYPVGSAYTLVNTGNKASSWKVTDVGEIQYRVSVTGSGTMSTKIFAKMLARNP